MLVFSAFKDNWVENKKEALIAELREKNHFLNEENMIKYKIHLLIIDSNSNIIYF